MTKRAAPKKKRRSAQRAKAKTADVWLSVVDYRPDPTTPAVGRIFLGVVLEMHVDNLWAVQLRARAGLTDEEMNTLDGIARDLLKSPFDFLHRDIETTFPMVHRPGEVTARLAREHRWSIHVATPQHHRVSIPAKATDVAAADQRQRAFKFYEDQVEADRAGAFFGKTDEWSTPLPRDDMNRLLAATPDEPSRRSRRSTRNTSQPYADANA